MKKLLLTLAICLGCMGILGAQNIWKPINGTGILGVGPDGSIFAYNEYGKLTRSQDEGGTWQIVLGQETGFTGHINASCFAVSNEGRICVFNDNQQTIVYSDDNGDTWQQTPSISSCAMPYKTGICAPTNDIFVVWAEEGEIHFTLDGGETWGGSILEMDEESRVGDMIVNAEGDVYVSVCSYSDGDAAVFHSTLADIENWELFAAEDVNVTDMAFDPEGNVVACGWKTEGSVGFQHVPGFYLFDGTSLAISDGGVVYTPHFTGLQAVLSYSTDHGEHFIEIGEHLPLVDIAPGGENAHLFKGADNHLYFDGGGEYWKSIRDADQIQRSFPLENTAWVQFYRSMYEDSTYYQLGIKGDTVVNETAYKKVINCAHLGYPIEGECFGGIREDADGKCYFMSFVPAGIYAPWPLHYDCEVNTEYPLYDFSLSVCDVFQTIGLTPHVVFDTAAMELNGSMRKVLWFNVNCDDSHYYDYQWIEGIGSTHSLLYPIQCEPDNGPEYRLVEVWQDEEMIYRNPHFDDYVPMIKEGNQRQKWNVVVIGSMNYPNDYHTEIQSIRDDITLDGVDYKIVWTKSKYGIAKAGAVREEDRRVYYRRKISQNYQDEVLLYDFNLNVGDTVTVNWMGQQLMVLEESEVEVDGTMRRRLGLGYPNSIPELGEIEEYWIEGVGSTFGFLNSGYGSSSWVGSFPHLLCYYENDNLIWDNEDFDECVMNSDGAPATFAPQGAEWYFNVASFMASPTTYFHMEVLGDTLIRGHQCSVISPQYGGGNGDKQFVYEDNGVVYWYNQTIQDFTTLYDFNAEVGDTWICDIDSCAFEFQVQSIEEVVWADRTYRVQVVIPIVDDYYGGEMFFFGGGRIIEGIGAVGLFPNSWACNGGFVCGPNPDYLRCYLVDGEMLYHEGEYDCDEYGSCWDGTIAEAYAGGDGTAENPYQIKTSKQLALLAQQTNDGTGGDAYYEMTANVNLKDCLTGGGRPWVSIGTREHPFTGHFNGGGKSIMNLFQNFNDSDTQSIGGLFGYASNATLENVNVSNSTIEGVNFAGLIVGWAVNTTIMGCSVDGFISYSSNASCANGGVVGKVEVDYSTHIYIRNCINNATIQANIAGSSGGNVYYFGGIVGQAYVDDIWSNGNLYIVDCCNNGDLMGRGTIGGIAGDHEGIVENCDNFGQISASGTSGGIVGYTEGMIKNCHNHSNGSVTGNCTGGIVGYSLGGWTLSCVNNAPVIGQFKHSSPSASNKAGGIIGYGDHIFNCYNTGDVAFTLGDNMDEDAIYVGGIGGNIDECKNSYNIGAVASSELQYARCGIIAGCFYDTKNVYWHGDYDLPVYGIGEDPAGSCAFRSGATATSWVLDEAQYGTVDLVEALNAGASEIESQYPGLGFMSRWDYDTEMANNGFPVLGDAIEEFVFNGSEWYYEIENEDGSITYQYLESSADTTVNNQTVTIIIRTNTLYDKAGHTEVTHEYIYEENDVVYWWNKDLQEFTVLYDLGAEVGDEWEIKVGTESLVMHVDAVESVEYEGRTFKTLQVSDAEELFSGTIVCGIGHLTSFFPERLMNRGKGYRVEGIRCYWREGELVFKYGDRDCDEVYEEWHNGIEEDGPSTGSGTFAVYPNPTDGVLVVETQNFASHQTPTYRITNLMGQTLMSGTITAETQQIDVTNLPEGMYFITFAGVTRKFVVNR